MFRPLSFRKTNWRDLIGEGDFFLHNGNSDIVVVRFRLIPVAMPDKMAHSDMLDRLLCSLENHIATFQPRIRAKHDRRRCFDFGHAMCSRDEMLGRDETCTASHARDLSVRPLTTDVEECLPWPTLFSCEIFHILFC